jgi:hypothetical protein
VKEFFTEPLLNWWVSHELNKQDIIILRMETRYKITEKLYRIISGKRSTEH